jgi:hypothetical protein
MYSRAQDCPLTVPVLRQTIPYFYVTQIYVKSIAFSAEFLGIRDFIFYNPVQTGSEV